jgi:inner membrane protein
MPTIISHAAVPLAIGLGLGRRRLPAALVAAGAAAAMLPDLDVIGFRFGITYGDAFGHRGASHALAAAALLAFAAAWPFRSAAVPFGRAFLFLFAAAASHGLTDMLTNGGLGVALLWPASEARLFAPWRPIEVSPLGLGRFLSEEGLAVIASEALWLWCPLVLLAVALRRLMRPPKVTLDKHP